MSQRLRAWAGGLLSACLLGAAPLWASDCREISHDENSFYVCSVDLKTEELRLFLRDDEGEVHGHFTYVNDALAAEGKKLGFAMNAGMYHDDRSPVGFYLENGREEQRLITSEGPGNFGLLPNGVFCIQSKGALVMETRAFARLRPACTYASQSGPMLVIDGDLHPRFLADSTSHYVRNGVGISADGATAHFAISRNAVSFHAFGTLFKDVLKTPNALYFDGNISRLYAPQIRSFGAGWRVGPIVGTVVPIE